MALELVILPLILWGTVVAVRLPGPSGKRARKLLLYGLFTCLGGCVGFLGRLGAETSGSSNLFAAFHPFLLLAVFIVGVVLMVSGAIVALANRSKTNSGDKSDPSE